MVQIVSLLVLGLAHANAVEPDQTYLLAYKPPLNKAFHYDVETVVTGPSAATLKITKAVKATKLDAGVFTVVSTFDSVSFGMPGNEQAAESERLIKSSVVTQTINSLGSILKSDANRSVSQMLIGGIDAVNAIAFSSKPVKVGDTWNNTIDNNGSKLEVVLKLVRVGTEHGKQVASLKMGSVTASTTPPAMPLAFDIDLSSGVLQKLTMSAPPTASADKKSSINVTIKLR